MLRLRRWLGVPPQPEAHKAPEIGEHLSLVSRTAAISRARPCRRPAGTRGSQVPKDTTLGARAASTQRQGHPAASWTGEVTAELSRPRRVHVERREEGGALQIVVGARYCKERVEQIVLLCLGRALQIQDLEYKSV